MTSNQRIKKGHFESPGDDDFSFKGVGTIIAFPVVDLHVGCLEKDKHIFPNGGQ